MFFTKTLQEKERKNYNRKDMFSETPLEQTHTKIRQVPPPGQHCIFFAGPRIASKMKAIVLTSQKVGDYR